MAFVFVLILSFMWIWRGAFRAATTVFAFALLVALILAHLRRRESLRDIGFRADTLGKASALLAPTAAVIISLTLFAGYVSGSARLPPASTAVVSIATLVVFGLAQQYMLLGFFYRGFERVLSNRESSLFSTAALFAFFHLPNPFLTVVTFIAGLIAVIVYRRAPNLWINGIAHGLISFCLFYSLSPELTGELRVGPGYWTR